MRLPSVPVTALVMTAILGTAASASAQEPAPPPAESVPPRLTLRGFTNVDLGVNENDQPSTFSLGQFDMFVTSALSESWSFLAEVNFEFNDENELATDIERAQIRYAPSDRFSIAAGRMHTPLGYWNQTFHHGAWFQTTCTRPEMYLFEDEGGILPVHEIGLQASGTLHGSAVDFKYSASVVNGRGRIPDEVTNLQDRNGKKAFNGLLSFAPTGVRGLEVGGNTYVDQIPADPETPGREAPIDELILGGYLVYVRSDVEFLAEVTHVRHRDKGTDAEFGTWGFYVQGSKKFGHWRPYYRYDKVDVADGDPFLAPKDMQRHTAGLRVDAMPWAAIKGEYHLTKPHGGDNVSSGLFQVAFTF